MASLSVICFAWLRAGKRQCKQRVSRDFYIDASLTVIGRRDNDRDSLQIISHFYVATACDGIANLTIFSSLSGIIVIYICSDR